MILFRKKIRKASEFPGWTAQVYFPPVQDLSLLHSIETDCGAHPASFTVGTGRFSSGGEQAPE
jgi:hypothetical protein